eukprot:TRINITY_DN840_c0_g1_i1.p1 TRINITY_DN840_c0_g1~~TRINITY_DN840_c0_g1_i1.p1  ORF type:complete len:633 (+),score=236.59 TRINITY_DN840_c0_g1_i1:23-1921(+)
MLRPLALIALVLAFAAAATADHVSHTDLEGNVYTSRRCEIDDPFGLYVRRTFNFTEFEYTEVRELYESENCEEEALLGLATTTGLYTITDHADSLVPYTPVSIINLRPDKTIVFAYSLDLQFYCNQTFRIKRNVELEQSCFDFSSAPLKDVCPDGAYDSIAFYNGALFFGEQPVCPPNPTAPISEYLPNLLSLYGLIEPGTRNIMAVERGVRFSSVVRNVLRQQVLPANIMETVAQQSAYFSRYFSWAEGLDAARDVLQAFRAASFCNAGNVEVEEVQNVKHDLRFKQPSVIARLRGSTDGPEGELLVVVSAGLDSVNYFLDNGTDIRFPRDPLQEDTRWFTRPGPGADRSASAVGVLLEVFRVLVAAGYQPQRTIEFHLYGGQERGIVDGEIIESAGSELIGERMRSGGKEVVSSMYFESLGIPLGSTGATNCTRPVFGNITEYTLGVFTGFPTESDPASRELFFNSVNEYADSPYHAAYVGLFDFLPFDLTGYPTGGGVESGIFDANAEFWCDSGEQIHNTERDTIERIDERYLTQWAYSITGYLLEMGVPPASFPEFVSPTCPEPTPRPERIPPSPMSFDLPLRVDVTNSPPSNERRSFGLFSTSSPAASLAPLPLSLLLAAALLLLAL